MSEYVRVFVCMCVCVIYARIFENIRVFERVCMYVCVVCAYLQKICAFESM